MANSTGRRTVQAWVKLAEEQGWTVRQALRGGHLKWYRPNGTFAFSTGTQPGGGRALDAVRANMKRAGIKVN